jgi:hypothetical protein
MPMTMIYLELLGRLKLSHKFVPSAGASKNLCTFRCFQSQGRTRNTSEYNHYSQKGTLGALLHLVLVGTNKVLAIFYLDSTDDFRSLSVMLPFDSKHYLDINLLRVSSSRG